MTVETDAEQALAVSALHEITPATTVGAFRDRVVGDDGVVTLTFHSTMAGYPGWVWNVAIATVDANAPTVLELELLPDDGSLIAPDWVPWSQRLAEYKEAARLAREAGELTDDDEPVIVPDDEDFDGDLGLAALDEDDDSDDEDDEDDDQSDDDDDDDEDDDEDSDDEDDDVSSDEEDDEPDDELDDEPDDDSRDY
ncbi:MAG: DUF3027 domain-containing protein [Microbacteriaceae bacterium]